MEPRGHGHELDKKTYDLESLGLRDLAYSNIIDLFPVLIRLAGRTSSPWAILLVHFRDDPGPYPPLTIYQDLFTSAGSGSLNMVDFFYEMTHGELDLSGSQVFGWYTLPANRAEYVGNVYPQPAGRLNRNGYRDLAKATATAAGVNLSNFAG